MAAGLGFKDFVTGEVLTAADVDGYLMQGVWVFASAAARNSAVTSPQEGNMCFLKDTNAIEYYDGANWVAISGGSSSGLDLISTTTIGTTVSTVTVSSAFSSTYDNYLVLISGGSASGNCNLTLQLGSTTSGYYWFGYYGVTSSATVTGINGSNTANFSYAGIGSTNDINSITTIQAPYLAKRTHISTTSSRANTASNPTINRNEGFEDSNTQHTAFTIAPDSGTITGGTIKVYGYKN
jgi:hypothetical protein